MEIAGKLGCIKTANQSYNDDLKYTLFSIGFKWAELFVVPCKAVRTLL